MAFGENGVVMVLVARHAAKVFAPGKDIVTARHQGMAAKVVLDLALRTQDAI